MSTLKQNVLTMKTCGGHNNKNIKTSFLLLTVAIINAS